MSNYKPPRRPLWERNPERWNNLNEGQKRYATEQWRLSLVRRGLDPFPDGGHPNLPSTSAESEITEGNVSS